jgi:hypothetical protein
MSLNLLLQRHRDVKLSFINKISNFTMLSFKSLIAGISYNILERRGTGTCPATVNN